MRTPRSIQDERPALAPVPAHLYRSLARLLALAFVAGLAVFAVPSAPAGATTGPASLKASPSTVVIPLGKTTGTYMFTWNTGSNTPAEFRTSLDGGPDGPVQHAAASGRTTRTIDFGQTITWKMFTKGSATPKKSITITTRRPDRSCEGQCIKDVQVTPHGTYADIHVVLTAPMAAVQVFANVPGQPTSSQAQALGVKDWYGTIPTLTPATDYEFSLRAADESGNIQNWVGSFTTLRRQVQVSFDTLHVIDDSDDLSAGDLYFSFNVNGVWDDTTYGEVSVDSGDKTYPAHVETLLDTDQLTLIVHGRDDDCDPTDGLCDAGTAPQTSGGGSNSEMDWSTTSATTGIITATGPGEAFTDTLYFQTTANALKFGVSVTYTVSYI
jgi:hypothetical protein